jgi:hypothetical protein
MSCWKLFKGSPVTPGKGVGKRLIAASVSQSAESVSANMKFELQIHFHGDLAGSFLRAASHLRSSVVRELSEKTSVKDVIEACGIPHPEVDLIIVTTFPEDPVGVDFGWQVERPVRIDVYGVPAPRDILPSLPRLQTRLYDRFVADGHLGTLARNLRLLGFDTTYESGASDRRLLEIMSADDRALLTRDRRLLMHSVVRHGYCPRSSDPARQTSEVLCRFGLKDSPALISPFSRCLRCNGLLKTVSRREVAGRLAGEPRTLLYYDSYRLCTTCGQIFWAGSHFFKLTERVARFVGS